ILRRLTYQAIVFHLWKQRNNVIHNKISLSTAEVFRLIDKDIRTVITAKKKRKHFSSLMSLWLRKRFSFDLFCSSTMFFTFLAMVVL
ncbi:hypothetical protein DY000_02003367, partial [Brassica cretica]